MFEKKRFRLIIGLLIVILFAVAIFASYGVDYMQSKKALNNFLKLIEQEKTDDIRLTIYYAKPGIFTPMPLSVDMLINSYKEDVIYISSLKEHIDLLRQINTGVLIPVENEYYLNARLCYVFETEKDGKILEVVMDNPYASIVFVNGLKVQGNDILTDVIRPFLTEDAAKELYMLPEKTTNSN